ncbi:MAG: hypothetical protein ACLFWL_08310 [Candidatus Brocadiia bacterium]
MNRKRIGAGLLLVIFALIISPPARAAEVQIVLPENRKAYQTNERIDLAVVRTSRENLPEGELMVRLRDEGSGQISFTFPVESVAAVDGQARTTEHVRLNGWLLRPGHYDVSVSVDGATAEVGIDVFSHERYSSYKLIAWSGVKGKQYLKLGRDGYGFTMVYAQRPSAEYSVRAGVDFMKVCTMSGGHQMDLRMECDWSDPYVVRGGTRRVTHRAMQDRTAPTCMGVHFYDEPGLTWHKHPETGEMTAHGVPPQKNAYRGAWGNDPIPYHEVDLDDPRDVERWKKWARWKLSFMDAAWKHARFGVDWVRRDFLSATQSQYGWSAFTDGYYFNVTSSLPVASGHGGYDSYMMLTFNPSFYLEMSLARDMDRPCWYLPCWWANTTPACFRLEQYFSFIAGIEGLMTPPPINLAKNPPAAPAVEETNKTMARLGPVFNHMPKTRQPLAFLYSMSDNIETQARDMKFMYAHAQDKGMKRGLVYLASKIMQTPMTTVVEEDILDGTLARHHRAVVLTAVNHLDPAVNASLERFIDDGGSVVMTGDCSVDIEGAKKVDIVPRHIKADELEAAFKIKDKKKKKAALEKLNTTGNLIKSARRIVRALKPHLEEAGTRPAFESSEDQIVAGYQAHGDVEYYFGVNAAYDFEEGGKNNPVATTARIVLPRRGPFYDAVYGGEMKDLKHKGNVAAGKFEFQPGGMRVFARTARPIGSVKAHAPVLESHYTRRRDPSVLNVAATVLDDEGEVINGSIPLRVRVIGPNGEVRYDLFRATENGLFSSQLQFGVNEPAGKWKVIVTDLLAETQDTAEFAWNPPDRCGAMCGMERRAIYFGRDREHIYRFFRVHKDITVVKGEGDGISSAAMRLAKTLEPWGVEARIVAASEVNKPRKLTEEEAKTWCGLHYAGSGTIKPGQKNPIKLVGFALRGPAILLGNPDNNPLIAFLDKEGYLPYKPEAGEIPGRGRGMMAWQLGGIGRGQESITLIAHDAEGMEEAVGTVYEAAIGFDPLTRWILPAKSEIVAPGE